MRYIFRTHPNTRSQLTAALVMPSWYDIADIDIGAKQDAAGIHASQAEIEKFIAQEKTRGVAVENIFLAGFSQGGAIALHTGLRHPGRLGGIIALSTYLPLADTLSKEASLSAKNTPIFFAHGRHDPVFLMRWKTVGRKIKTAWVSTDWHEYAMPHSVNTEEISDIEKWLTQRLV